MARINGFEQIKGFYSWSFENQEKGIKSHHVSLYMFLVNQNNRNSWVEWFKLPMDLGMAGSCISSKKTYYSCLADLQEWGLIEYQKGVNDWKAPLIRLEVLKDTSTVPQSEPQLLPQVIPQLPPQPTPQVVPQVATQLPPNIKLETINYKPKTDDDDKEKTPSSNLVFFTIHDFEKIEIGESDFSLYAYRQTKRSIEQLKVLQVEFVKTQKALTKIVWKDEADAKQHFINWVKKQPVGQESKKSKGSVIDRWKERNEK